MKGLIPSRNPNQQTREDPVGRKYCDYKISIRKEIYLPQGETPKGRQRTPAAGSVLRRTPLLGGCGGRNRRYYTTRGHPLGHKDPPVVPYLYTGLVKGTGTLSTYRRKTSVLALVHPSEVCSL